MTVGYYKNYLYTHRYKLSSEKKKKSKESQYRVSYPKTGSDSPIRSDQESGRDITNYVRTLGIVITRSTVNSKVSVKVSRECSTQFRKHKSG